MSNTIHVLALVGSLRAGSYNRAVLRAAQELVPPGMEIASFDLAPIPFYNADVEAQGFPEPVQALRSAIAGADALLFVTPEYNHSIPGVLKNAIEWASRAGKGTPPLSGKPFAMMSASTGGFGGARAQLHLRQIAGATNMFALNRPAVIIPFVGKKVDESGRLTDEATREFIADQLDALADWARRFQE